MEKCPGRGVPYREKKKIRNVSQVQKYIPSSEQRNQCQKLRRLNRERTQALT